MVKPSGKSIFSNEEHPEKQSDLMSEIDLGILTLCKDVQPEKQFEPMTETDSGISRLCKDVQPEKQ